MLDSLDTLIAFVLIMLVVSLLITIAVQMVSSALNLRGLNLAQGLKRAFTVIDPNTDQDAKKLANFVLKGRFLSDSFLPNWGIFKLWRHAEAIRPQELFDAIQRIAIGKEPTDKSPSGLKTLWNCIQRLLGKQPSTGPSSLRQNLKSVWVRIKKRATGKEPVTTTLRDSAEKILIELGVSKETIEKASKDLNSATQVFSAAGAINPAYQQFEYWTGICQERAQQWLTMHTRILTIIFAFVAAFWLQLDTVEIFKLVSSNKAVRDKLVAQAGAVEAQASRIFGADNNVLKDAVRDWSQKQTDPAIKSALAGIEIKDSDTRESVRDKVAIVLNGKKPIDSFDALVNLTALNRIKTQAGDFQTVKADFDKSGFDLFPKDNAFRWGKNRWDRFNEHWVGMLFSVGLLSLGAPFWYNTLKNLVSLRSTVAQNITKEQDQVQKQPDGDKPKPPPPTVMPVVTKP